MALKFTTVRISGETLRCYALNGDKQTNLKRSIRAWNESVVE